MLERVDRSTIQAGAASRDDDEVSISLIDIIAFAVSKWLTIAFYATLVFGLAVLYVVQAKPSFTAQAELLIDARSPQFLREQLGEVGLNLDAGQIESQIAVLRSEQIALVVINKLNMLDEAKSQGDSPAGAAPDVAVERQHLRQLITAFQNGLYIRRKGVSYVIEVAYIADSPERAALLANAAADAFIEDQLAARGQATKQGSLWLEERIEEIRVQMNRANLKVQEFKSRRDYRIRGTRLSDPDKPQPDDKSDKSAEADSVGTATTLEELKSTALTYRKIFESFLVAYAESIQRQSYPGTNARVISRATPPLTKSAPKTGRILAAAVVAGLLLGLGIAILQQIWSFTRSSRRKLGET